MSNCFFFFNDTATTEIYTLSLHDALPISTGATTGPLSVTTSGGTATSATSFTVIAAPTITSRSEEHTSELQSRLHLVCRLLLEKKNSARHNRMHPHHATNHTHTCWSM